MWKIFKTTLCVYDPKINGYSEPKEYDEYTVVVIEGKKEKSNSLRFVLTMDELGSKIKEINFGPFYYQGRLNEIETLFVKEKILKMLKEYLTEKNINNLKNRFADKRKYVNKLVDLIKGDDFYDET